MDITDRATQSLKSRDLQVLAVIIEAGSVSGAAEQMQTSQAAICGSVANLEQALGVALLERTSRGGKPTAHGRTLIAIYDRNRDADRGNGGIQKGSGQPGPGRRDLIQMAATSHQPAVWPQR
jgi:molybdate transport repressor ModE-like protein